MPTTFQRLMETVLTGLIGECWMAYLDNIPILGETFDAYLQSLQKVFDRLKEANLQLHPKKCCFASAGVDYLGSAAVLSNDPRSKLK